jgi:hypothetical protein
VWCGGVVVWRLNASRHQAQGYPEKHGRESLVWSSTHPAAVEPGLANVSGTELKLTVGEGRRSQEPSRDPPEALSFKEAGAFLLAPRGRGRFSPPTAQRGKVPPPWRRGRRYVLRS